MSRDHLVEFLQGEGKIRFEEQFHRKFYFLKHYEPGKLNGFLKLAGISREVDDELILENLGVAEKINDVLKMKNAGVLFFSKSIELLLEHATITCCVFDGIEQVDVINRKDYQDGAIANIDFAMHFVKQELRVRYEMTGEPKRKEIYEIPLEANREAIVNAVSHRDYFQYGAHTTVYIFDDRIEIGNPGGLPKGLSPEEFGKKAVRRNQIVASLLQRVNLAENLGTGILKIKRLLKGAGCPVPEFEFGNFFTIILKKTAHISQTTTNDGGLNGGLKTPLLEVYSIIVKNPGVKVKELQENLERPVNTLEKQIRKLVSMGIIEHRGSKKTGGYYAIPPGNIQ
ncbi:hypothetical protein ES705_26298 [subsurface metagenome]